MNAYEIILKKRNKGILTKDEIKFILQGFVKGEIPDYQMSAFLMTIWYNKLTEEELINFTEEMINSGEKLNIAHIKGPKVDKHSTGGVGDGTSLIIAPIVAAAGGIVPMIAGRGLGHTGGTLDKLESIPGFKVDLTEEKIIKNLEKIGVVITGQTQNIVPADLKMYALRDVTATVDSMELISSSIMSKKIAESIEGLVLDVKTGSGALMKDIEDAKKLALTMMKIGQKLGVNIFAYITNMSQPLGKAVGNAVEVIQAIEILKGSGPKDITELSIILSAKMLELCGIVKNFAEGEVLSRKTLESGKALEKFKEIVENQNGDVRVIDDYKLFPQAEYKEIIPAPADCYIKEIDAFNIGLGAVKLGAGREKLNDEIDYSVGFIFHKKVGDKITKKEPILTILSNDKEKIKEIKPYLQKAYKFTKKPLKKKPVLIFGSVDEKGFNGKEILI